MQVHLLVLFWLKDHTEYILAKLNKYFQLISYTNIYYKSMTITLTQSRFIISVKSSSCFPQSPNLTIPSLWPSESIKILSVISAPSVPDIKVMWEWSNVCLRDTGRSDVRTSLASITRRLHNYPTKAVSMSDQPDWPRLNALMYRLHSSLTVCIEACHWSM